MTELVATSQTADCTEAAKRWWKASVFYQIYPRSFSDSNKDGVGDLQGIINHIDYIKWLGVDAIWLSPIYKSPMFDFGYDVSDHAAVDPLFGDLSTFDSMVEECHRRDIKVMMDWVPNHTSDQHPWFQDSTSSRDSAKRDWYLWRDPKPDGSPPNNWRSHFGGPAWTFDENTHQWYLHLFLPEQPDLNWANPEVEHAMHDILRFWLDRGVDGFRADVVHLIGKDEALPDQPAEMAHMHLVHVHDHPHTHELLRNVRNVLNSYTTERALVGEINFFSARQLAPYYGIGDELHMVFNFALVNVGWDAQEWAEVVAQAEGALGGEAWPVWVLSNHDVKRHRTRFGDSERRARVAGMILLTLRGTPFLYAGEELGLLDAEMISNEKVDPGDRDGCRAPIPWNGADDHGWEGAEPWQKWPPEAWDRNVADLQGNDRSILHLYKRLLAARKNTLALQVGDWRLLDAPPGVLLYERSCVEGDRRRVVANFVGSTVCDIGGGKEWTIEVATEKDRENEIWDGRLRAEEAVLLRPSEDSHTVHASNYR